jgi:hypothetical protein
MFPEAVVVKAGHRREVCGQGLAFARLNLLDEVVNGLLDDGLGGVVALRRPALIGRIAAVALRRSMDAG